MTDHERQLRALIADARQRNRAELRDALCSELEWAIEEIKALQAVTVSGDTPAGILREVMETIYFDLRSGKPVADIIQLAGDTLNDDAAIRGRFAIAP